jgi:hypothetical protein
MVDVPGTTTNFGWQKIGGQVSLEPRHYNDFLDELDTMLVGFDDDDANQTILGTLTVGVDDTGYDVKFFGATTAKSWLWDESADKMIVTGASDLLGNTQQTGTFTVGVDDTGYDVTFFGATTGKKLFWDESADTLFVVATLDVDGPVLVGVDDTGYDVTFFGATTGKKLLWDESADTLFVTGEFVCATGSTGADFSTGGLRTKQSVANVNDTTPTNAELDSAFGAATGRGFIGTIDDNDADTIGYIVWSTDASWFWVIGTKAT